MHFPVVGRFRNNLRSPFELVVVKRWNFDAVYHSSRDIIISGLGGHIAISGFLSSQLFGNTFELAIVENLDIVT